MSDFCLPKIPISKGELPLSNSKNSSNQNPVSNPNKPQNIFTKKLGQTTYTIQVYFSETSKENFSDKLLRLIKNDITKNADVSQLSKIFPSHKQR